MPDYAGYAAAVTIRDRVFNDAFVSAYHAGLTSHTLAKTFQQLPSPAGSLNLFLQPPRVILSAADHTHVVMRLGGWGTIGLRVSPYPAPYESRTVQWQADLLVAPRASVGTIVFLSAKKTEYRLVDWQFDVLTGTAFSAMAQAYLNGAVFRDQMETWLRDLVGDLLFPIVNFRFLGPFSGSAFTTIAVRAVSDALVLGFDMDDGSFATAGDLTHLDDFAGNDDVAVVVNPAAIQPLMSAAREQVQTEVQQYDATLESLSITCEEGRFRVTGRASMTGGAANFSLAAVPLLTHTRPGAFIPLAKQTMLVKARTWPALSFAPADTSVDIDRSDWLALVEVIGGVATLGFIPFAVESFIADVVSNVTGGIASGDLSPAGPIPRVRRIGDPPLRLKIERFEIHTTGVLIGVTSRLEAPGPEMSGLRSLPRNFANSSVRYEVRLPFEALPDDPLLRIRWTVVDLDSGSILLNDDGAALNRLSIEFAPEALGSQVNRFAVGCRVYRVLGPFMTELLNETIRLEVGPPLAPGAFTRWRYDVKNPQIGLDAATETYSYRGDRVVRRWSKIHRVDKPCQNAQHRSRYTYSDEVLDNLPFPINDMNGNRYRLCDYCFFGGPASMVSTL